MPCDLLMSGVGGQLVSLSVSLSQTPKQSVKGSSVCIRRRPLLIASLFTLSYKYSGVFPYCPCAMSGFSTCLCITSDWLSREKFFFFSLQLCQKMNNWVTSYLLKHWPQQWINFNSTVHGPLLFCMYSVVQLRINVPSLWSLYVQHRWSISRRGR